MQKKPFLLVSAVILFTAFAFGGVAAYIFIQEQSLLSSGQQTQGTVVGLAESRDNDGTSSYAPIVRFQTSGERSYTFQSKSFSYPPQYEVNQTVTVLYDPEKPENAQVKGENFWVMIIFGSLGTIELIMGVYFLRKGLVHSLSAEGSM